MAVFFNNATQAKTESDLIFARVSLKSSFPKLALGSIFIGSPIGKAKCRQLFLGGCRVSMHLLDTEFYWRTNRNI